MIEMTDFCTNAHVVRNGYLVDQTEPTRDGSSTQIARIAPKIALGSGNTGMMMRDSGIRTSKLVSEKVEQMIQVVSIYGPSS